MDPPAPSGVVAAPREPWWVALVLCTLLGALPVACVHHVPMQDYPQHVLFAQVITHLDDPAFDYGETFDVDFHLRPYIGAYGLAWLLHPLVGADAALRLGLLIYAVGTPFAVLAYVRALSPARAPAALLAVAGVWSGLYFLGFVNFLVSVPFLFAGLAALLHHRRSGSAASASAFAASAAAAYLGHVASFGMLMVAGVALGPFAAPRRLRALGLVLVVGLLAVVVTPREGLGLPSLDVAYRPLGTGAQPYDRPGRPFLLESPLTSLLYLLAYIVRDAALIDAALWGLPIAALGVAAWSRRGAPRDPAPRERFVLPALALLLLFVAPGSTPSIDYVNLKFTTFFYLALPALVPARLLDRRTLATLVVFVVATVACNGATHLRFDAEAAPLDELIAALPPGKRVMPVILRPGSRALLWSAPYTHIGCLVQVAKGGRGARIFEGPQIPVRLRERGLPVVGDYLTRPGLLPELIRASAPDYLLVRDPEGGRYRPPEGWSEVASRGDFHLFRAGTEPAAGSEGAAGDVR